MACSLIVAMDKSRGIGKNSGIPWHISEDMKFFREKTTGGKKDTENIVVMGSKTFMSIGKPLKNRTNLVMSRNRKYGDENSKVMMIHSLLNYHDFVQTKEHGEIFIIGGADIYNIFLPLAEKIYITTIDKEYDCDVFFPKLDDNWKKESTERSIIKDDILINWETWVRV